MRLWKRKQEFWVACSCGNLVTCQTQNDLSVLPCQSCRAKLSPPTGEEIKAAVLEPKEERPAYKDIVIETKVIPKAEPKPDPCLHMRCIIEERSLKRIVCNECKNTVGYCE